MAQEPSKNTHFMHIQKLEAQISYFTDTSVLSTGLVASLDKIIDLHREREDDYAKLTEATKSRHKAARSLLYLIAQDLGYDAFFLCAFALPLTMLATTKSHAKFLGTLRTWWTQANVPNSFIELTSKLYKQYNDVLPTRDSVAGPSKRSWTDQWSGTEGAVASSSNKRRRGIEARGQAHELGPVSEDLPTSSAFETDDEEVEEDDDDVGEGDDADEEGKEDGMNFEALEEQLEGSLAGMVYQLEPMDAIQVLASSKVNVLLTMPHRRWAKPFISFYCSEKTALRFLTKRNQVMELTQPAQFPQATQVPHLPQLAQSYTTHSK